MGLLLRAIRGLVAAVTICYAAALLAASLLFKTGTHGYWWLDLANIFALLLFAPLLLLAPMALITRSRAALLAVLAACAVFLWMFGPRLLPKTGQASGGAHLRVATFNLHSDRAERQVDEIIAAIRARPADVYMFQELSKPAAAAIREQLARDYPYQALVPTGDPSGMGVISRLPLDMAQRQAAPLQKARLRMGDASITLINVSLTGPQMAEHRIRGFGWVPGVGGYHTSTRDGEIARLLRAVDETRGPLVVAGDFNLSDREPDYERLAARLHDAYAETTPGFGFTFPSSLRVKQVTLPTPLIRIDYVWSAGGFIPTGAATSCGIVSDHCAVVADLKLS